MNFQILFLLILGIILFIFNRLSFEIKRKKNVYLKSDEWQRKRYVVLKRDNWKCVYCGNRATQVHHKRYTKKNIGKEPIQMVSFNL